MIWDFVWSAVPSSHWAESSRLREACRAALKPVRIFDVLEFLEETASNHPSLNDSESLSVIRQELPARYKQVHADLSQ
jgi:hypothetical protein